MFSKKLIAISLFSGLSINALAADVTVVKLGNAGPLSGPASHLGKDSENGTRLAIEDANAKGIKIGGKTVKFELMVEDDQGDPRQGTLVAQRLVDAGVKGVIGHVHSGTSIPASRLYSEAGIPQITPSATNPKYTQQGYKTTFRVVANDVQQGLAIGKFSVQELGGKTIAIVDDRTAYGQGLADEVAKGAAAAGGKVVAREYTTDKATDFMAILTRIRGFKPDVVFYGGVDAQAGPMVRQMKQLAINAKFIAGDASCTPQMIKLAGEGISDKVFCTQAGLPLVKMKGGKDFKARFLKRFGTEVQLQAPYAYDATMAIIESMKKANSVETAKYLPELAKLNIPAMTGNLSFDSKGDIKEAWVSAFNYQHGKWESVKSIKNFK